jgi:hypothetical protein
MPVKEIPPVESVIEMPGQSKDQIYAGTKGWLAQTFVSAKAVIEDDEKDEGRIIGNGRVKWPCTGLACLGQYDWLLGFTMRVDMKDDKMRVTFTNLQSIVPPSQGVYGGTYPVREDQMDAVRPALDYLRDDMKAAILSGKAKADW